MDPNNNILFSKTTQVNPPFWRPDGAMTNPTDLPRAQNAAGVKTALRIGKKSVKIVRYF
jgi:hypothetical protein